MLNVDKFYKAFHADWMGMLPEMGGLMISGRYAVVAQELEVSVVHSGGFLDPNEWIARVGGDARCCFLTNTENYGVKLFYDSRADQTDEAIKDCKRLFIDV